MLGSSSSLASLFGRDLAIIVDFDGFCFGKGSANMSSEEKQIIDIPLNFYEKKSLKNIYT